MVLRMSRMLLLMVRRRLLLLLRKLVPRYRWTAVASSTVHSQLRWHSPHHTTLMPVTTTTTTGRRTVVRIRQISARVSAFVRSVRIGPQGRWGVEWLLITITLETSTHRHTGRPIVMPPRVAPSVGKTDRLDSTLSRDRNRGKRLSHTGFGSTFLDPRYTYRPHRRTFEWVVVIG